MLKKIFLSEKETIQRIKENDRTILGELFVANEKMIKKHILANNGNIADAQDILQEAIIALWQNVNAGRFELNAKINTYLFAIAKNKWLAELRKRSKQNTDPITDDIQIENNDALQTLIKSEDSLRVANALDQLGFPCKDLLLLFYFEERNMTDIAKILGFANSDVAKAKKYQCKKSLEKLLTQNMNLNNK